MARAVVNQACNEASIKGGCAELPGWGTRMLLCATVLGPKLREDRSSFV